MEFRTVLNHFKQVLGTQQVAESATNCWDSVFRYDFSENQNLLEENISLNIELDIENE